MSIVIRNFAPSSASPRNLTDVFAIASTGSTHAFGIRSDRSASNSRWSSAMRERYAMHFGHGGRRRVCRRARRRLRSAEVRPSDGPVASVLSDESADCTRGSGGEGQEAAQGGCIAAAARGGCAGGRRSGCGEGAVETAARAGRAGVTGDVQTGGHIAAVGLGRGRPRCVCCKFRYSARGFRLAGCQSSATVPSAPTVIPDVLPADG